MRHRVRKVVALVFLIMLAAVLLAPVVIARADDGAAPEAGQPYTWAYLGTIAGATAATLLVVQYVKLPVDKVKKIPTRYIVFAIALGIMLIAKAATGGIAWADVPITIVNAFVVALSAMGSYELTFANKDRGGGV